MKKISFKEAIKALEEGKKVYNGYKSTNYWVYSDNKALCMYNHEDLVRYNSVLYINDDFYLPEEPKPFEITETGFYKTRSGLKALVCAINYDDEENKPIVYAVETSLEGQFCSANGLIRDGEECSFDIIGKWGEQ